MTETGHLTGREAAVGSGIGGVTVIMMTGTGGGGLELTTGIETGVMTGGTGVIETGVGVGRCMYVCRSVTLIMMLFVCIIESEMVAVGTDQDPDR